MDRVIYWKLGYWLARKYKRGFRKLMRDNVRSPEPGKAKTWVLQGRNSRGFYGEVALRRLITSRKGGSLSGTLNAIRVYCIMT